MKKSLTLIASAVLLVALSANAQNGRIIFASGGGGVNAKFQLPADHPLGQQLVSGSLGQFRADLFWVSGSSTVGMTSEDLLNQAHYDQPFLNGFQAGYFAGGLKQLTNWLSGTIVAQVRVWDTSFGDYDTAKISYGSSWFESPLFTILPTTSPTPAPNLVGLGSGVTYTLTYVPEPSSLALFAIGCLACSRRFLSRPHQAR